MLCREKVPGVYLREEDGNRGRSSRTILLFLSSVGTDVQGSPIKQDHCEVTVMPNSIKGHSEVKAAGVATQPTLNIAHWHKGRWICMTFGLELCERSDLHTFSFLLK